MTPDEIVKELLTAGVCEAVVCGGARNANIVASFVAASEALEEVQVWKHFDERSAGFFALGRTMASRQPTAVVVTSGTAVAELLPAVVEAHYQGQPLLVISADRPAGSRGSGAPQVIEQVGIFKDMVEACADIAIDADDARKQLSDALGAWTGQAPLHLNLCLDELPVGKSADWQMPGLFQPKVEPLRTGNLAKFLREDIWKGLVIMLGGIAAEDREEVLHFCKAVGAPVLADATSGLREMLGRLAITDGDVMLRKHPPGKILRIGDVPVGRFWRDLETLDQVEVFSISKTGLSGLARPTEVVKGAPARVLASLGQVEEVGDVLDHFKKAKGHQSRMVELLETFPSSEPSLVRTLSVMTTTGESVFLGNSLPIREWTNFAQTMVPYDEVRAMRGANGIDGQISCWLGATADESESWALLGDLTTLYDGNGLAFSRQVEGKKVLAVINNGGGQIFARLPRLEQMDDSQRAAIEQGQDVDFAGLAKLWKVGYLKVSKQDDYDELDEIGDGVTLMEIVPDKGETEAFWKRRG